MSASLENGLAGLQGLLAEKLIPFIDAKPPLPMLAKAQRTLAKARIPGVGWRVFEFFREHPNEKDAIRALAEVGGQDAIEMLVGRTKNPGAKNRDLIAELLGGFRTFESSSCLADLLGDPDRFVRFQAAHSLFAVGGQDAALILCKFISDPDEWISMTILRLLCRLREQETIPHLIQHFARDTDIRRKALMVSSMSMFKSVTLVNIFDEGLRSRDARLKANSIEAIGELELPMREIETRVIPFLQDPNNRIRANALLILARTRPEMATPGIAEMVESGDNQLRRSAAYILGQIDPAGKEEFVRKLIVDPVNDVKKRMILSLKTFPFEFVRELLEHALKDPNKWIRKAAVEVAGTFPDFPKGPILKLLKAETVYPNLVSCMEFFAANPDDEALKIIRSRLQDPRWQVVSAAIRTIGALQGREGLEPLQQQMLSAKDLRVITAFAREAFYHGSLDVFNAVLDRASAVKRPWVNDRYLPALEACVELISSERNLPPALAALSAKPVPAPQEPPPQAESIEKEEVQAEVEYPKEFLTGLNFYNLGKYDEAKGNMQAALREQPELDQAHLYLGLMAAEEKNYAEARESLQIYLKSNPDNQKAALLLGKVCKALRDWPTAVRIYRDLAESSSPPNPKVLLSVRRELGIALMFLERSEEALDILGPVFNLDPSDAKAGFYLATALFNVGNFAQAREVLEGLRDQLSPDDPNYGMITFLLAKVEAAVNGGGTADEPRDPDGASGS